MVYKRDMSDWEKEQTLAKKPKKRKSQYNRPSAEDRIYGETDIMYGEVAQVPRFKVTDADKRLKTEAYLRWLKGNPNYYYAPGKGRA